MSNSVCLPTVTLYQSNKQGHITKTNQTKKKKNCWYCSLVFCCVLLYEKHSSDTCTIIIYFHAELLPVAWQPPHRSYFPTEFEFISLWSDEHSRGPNCRSTAVEIVVLWLNTFLTAPLSTPISVSPKVNTVHPVFPCQSRFLGGNPGREYHTGKLEALCLLCFCFLFLHPWVSALSRGPQDNKWNCQTPICQVLHLI